MQVIRTEDETELQLTGDAECKGVQLELYDSNGKSGVFLTVIEVGQLAQALLAEAGDVFQELSVAPDLEQEDG